MTGFRMRPVEVSAVRWWANGDHPDDGPRDREGRVVRYFRHPKVPGDQVCEQCGSAMDLHGWIDVPTEGHTVCPGDWVVTGVRGERYPVKDALFHSAYEPVGEI